MVSKWWGPRNKQPWLALHGWLDNAGTFDTLAPLLPSDIALLCIDLPGHGYSSPYPEGHFYYIHWDGLIVVRQLVKHFKWRKISIIGHSLGGAIAFLYAASFPEETEAIICLDVASPAFLDNSRMVKMTGNCIDKFLKYEKKTKRDMPCYPYDEMLQIMMSGHGGSLTLESCEIMMKRGSCWDPASGNFLFTRDVRLLALTAFISHDVALEYASNITCKVLNIKALPGPSYRRNDFYDETLKYEIFDSHIGTNLRIVREIADLRNTGLPVQFGFVTGESFIPKMQFPWYYKLTYLDIIPCFSPGIWYKMTAFKEVKIPVPWGHVSGKWWGSQDQQPVLALHGWQDNAGTFDALAPLLSTHFPLLCIDLPGHGFSSHFPKGQFYFLYWDGLIVVRRIMKHYGWKKVSILGHSLGGSIGFMYAATFPDDIEKLVCIDIASPTVRGVPYFVQQTGAIVEKFLLHEELQEDTVPTYTYDEMMKIMLDAYRGGLTKESCEIMLKRGAIPVASGDDSYRFSRDSRLKVGGLGFMSLEMSLEYASKITCEVLNIRAIPGMKFDPPENYQIVLDRIKESAKKLEYCEVEGTHFLHLNTPEKVLPIIADFLK
ncbi:hypothetical protein C0J52_05758 [Blattella germanica]|nr:hypothetical protein C0J52_05758 [Blattella germanica]